MLEVGRVVDLPYRYAVGEHATRFLGGLKDGQILASRCLHCGLVLVPPRPLCVRCRETRSETISVGPQGTLVGWTVLSFPFLDPHTGAPRPLPYAYGMIRFDGADNTFQYFLEETDASRLRFGARVEARFNAERNGRLDDLLPFRVVTD
ncbi:MAG: Zn-ribbon domain-containing OB-fold protein [Candidatus Xenobia bacterium]